MKRKVAIVGTVGIPACYGGFESLVENITFNKSPRVEYCVFCSSKAYETRLNEHNKAQLVYLPLNANGVASVIYDVISLIYCIFKRPDVILVLGVSGCIFLPVVRLLSSAKIITNIDGLEWKRVKWSGLARRFLKISEAMAIRFSHEVVTDNEAITNYVLKEYGVKSATIAYGGDHALFRPLKEQSRFGGDYFLGICRIEPENNVHLILEAFRGSNFKLKFVGNWDASAYGLQLRKTYSNEPNIELLGPVYDIESLHVLRESCKGYVHGHSAGGTNPSLVEMMHFGKPIYAFNCDFNRYSTEGKALYFSSASELVSLIECSIKESDEAGCAMKEIAVRRYRWSIVASEYEDLY